MTEVAVGKKIYIMLSQTGTLISRLIKKYTKEPYNHISLSLKPSLNEMYSFGRRLTYYPLWAGFIRESVGKGIYKRFPQSQVIVLEIDVSEEQYNGIFDLLAQMYGEKSRYKYNYKGLFFAGFQKCRQSERRYYCSEFVRYIFEKFKINGYESLDRISTPSGFLKIPAKVVYKGAVSDFNM